LQYGVIHIKSWKLTSVSQGQRNQDTINDDRAKVHEEEQEKRDENCTFSFVTPYTRV